MPPTTKTTKPTKLTETAEPVRAAGRPALDTLYADFVVTFERLTVGVSVQLLDPLVSTGDLRL